jgi:HAD superfamily phosphoserine phosphatase-like hydrolase
MGYAFFDLDHTLLPHDTQALFCNYVLRRERWRTLLHLFFLPFALLKAIRLISTLRAKRAFMSYLWGMPRARLQQYAKDFAYQSAMPWCYEELLDELERHRKEGRQLVLNTASPDFYAEHIAEALGFDHWVATTTQLQNPLALHPSIQENNKREAKIPHMLEKIPALADLTEEDRNAFCFAYTDSRADLPLLRFGKNGVVIHPSASMATMALREHWVILHPRRPYSGSVGNVLSILRQMLGLYPEKPRA